MYQFFSINVEQFHNDILFEEKLSQVSTWRRDKIESLRFRKDRNLSLGVAILLDEGLKQYGLREKDMRYASIGNGKPVFSEYRQIHFSLSHSGEMAVAALSDREIGCDIEKVEARDPEQLIKIAARFFSKQEYVWLMERPMEEQMKAFYHLWTRKESYLKRKGTGLQELDKIKELSDEKVRFSMEEIPGYICTICESIGEG